MVHEPVGVVAAIAPWNGPFGIMANKVAYALLTGCTVVMKPSPETPLEAYIIAEAAEAGMEEMSQVFKEKGGEVYLPAAE